ncbi:MULTISPECIES: phosphotransferase family protein [Rhodococcus]|uniref:Phosphotransferase family protein n=1 Tax=Rhodococcus oxybenzonivorans TaxID=1990687 RepID=A0AAE4UWE9_9NOCA|nr:MULTISPECIES: phosphotransferase family protein [Rhodococcus]MDV7243319.1 phosphotransferase family protein [Rhodococcus oxybenzonivorans]MDV7263980.1 phosphotransferase family protein [Rhodococcus oxybenzonivorans]MDV7276747.1 phosphotransferase family protein [Rhodococcus oxybenzonivorans]MDV7334422.1 phosphotransferase family protein [Rhodococcus oxybenzonivorans]MDV7344577.1 phosphotransferase family protein [Rhodococcus oxybenzonivorans]
MSTTATPPPGLDLARLGAWFAAEIPGADGPLRASLIAGGKSNLTYQVTDGRSTWIVRRPPLGHVLATAHDMGREYRVMSALQDTAVPVPTTYALCQDPDVLGAPFYVMERCAGTPYRRAADLNELGAARTRIISTRLVDTLAALHQVDPRSVGLADFGKPEGFLARQVGRWKKQLDASHNRDLPAADELYARLSADVPEESATGIVHGDYRLDNLLIDADDHPTAVLDWEMATLGDPLTDLALMLTYHRLGDVLGSAATADASSASGFLAESDIIARYAAGSDRDLTRFGFYLGLAAFKLAAILEGIHYRYLRGQTVGDGFDIGDAVHPLLDAGLDALTEYH